MHARRNCNAIFPRDRVGKVFQAFVYDTRRCLVCERLFSWEASREHSDVPCKASVPDQWLLRESSALILPMSTGA
jgi:uncharacterized protein (DUF983 family)